MLVKIANLQTKFLNPDLHTGSRSGGHTPATLDTVG
jgi:hypothetical protein